jgi:hypothetical protein
MDDGTDGHLAIAAGVDVDALGAALLAGDPSRFENPVDLVRTMVGRTIDAHAPMILDLARRARAGGLAPAGGVTVRAVAFPTPWQVGFALEEPGSEGFLYCVDLVVPVDLSPTLSAEVARNSEALRSRLEGEGLTGADLERQVHAARIVDEILLEEKAREGAVPDDLPDADGFSRIDRVRIVRYAAAMAAGREGEGFASYAARARNAVGMDLAATVAAIAKGAYVPDPVAVMGTAHSFWDPEDGGERDWTEAANPQADPMLWAAAFERLRPVALAAGQGEAMRDRARAIASRPYVTFSDPGLDRALAEIGAALALRDGGLPGREALSWIRDFEAGIVALRCAGAMPAVEGIAEALEEWGHTDRDSRFDFNDLDDTLCTTGRGDGPEVITLTVQNGDYLILPERDAGGDVVGLSFARVGLPLEDYLARVGKGDPLDLDRMRYGEFHRDFANPADPEAPLARDAAVAALVAGRDDFPGFIARLRDGDAGPRCVALGALSTRTIRDVSGVVHGIERGMHAIEEDRAERAPGPR